MSPPFKKLLNVALISSFLVLILLSTNFFSFASSGFDGSVVSAQSPISVGANLTLTSATPGNAMVFLVWTAPTGNDRSSIIGHKVYRCTTSGGETLHATLGNVLTYTDSSLTNGKNHYCKINAINSKGEGLFLGGIR